MIYGCLLTAVKLCAVFECWDVEVRDITGTPQVVVAVTITTIGMKCKLPNTLCLFDNYVVFVVPLTREDEFSNIKASTHAESFLSYFLSVCLSFLHRSLSSFPSPPPLLPSITALVAMENSSVASASSEAGSTRSQEIEELERFIDSYVLEYQVQGLLGDKADGDLDLDNGSKVPQVRVLLF